MRTKSILLTLLAVFSIGVLRAEPDAETLLRNADAAASKYKQFTFTFKYTERFRGGKLIKGDMDCKIIEGPNKLVYVNAREPEKAELIWGAEGHEGKVWVKKGFLKLNLDPFSNMLLKSSHHPIYRSGFLRTRDIIMTTYNARKDDVNDMVKIVGSVKFDGRDCWNVVLTDSKYQVVNYTVKAGESLVTIAEKKGIPEMRMLELNPDVDDYFDIKAGDVIKIPTSYGKVTTLYVDKQTYLPIYQKVTDDLGLFTEYSYLNLNVNPGLSKADFNFE